MLKTLTGTHIMQRATGDLRHCLRESGEVRERERERERERNGEGGRHDKAVNTPGLTNSSRHTNTQKATNVTHFGAHPPPSPPLFLSIFLSHTPVLMYGGLYGVWGAVDSSNREMLEADITRACERRSNVQHIPTETYAHCIAVQTS